MMNNSRVLTISNEFLLEVLHLPKNTEIRQALVPAIPNTICLEITHPDFPAVPEGMRVRVDATFRKGPEFVQWDL